MNKRLQTWKLALLFPLFFACEEAKEQQAENTPGIETQYMDKDVKPQDDFYSFVNGNWMKETEIPDDRTRWGGFQVLRKKTDDNVLEILKETRTSGEYPADSDQGKALVIFDDIMDTIARNEAGVKPVLPILKMIDEVESITDLQTLLAKNPSLINTPFFSFSAYADPDDSSMNVAYIGTGSLGLPERDYYLNDDEESEEIRQEYVAHITRMLQYLGDDEASAKEQAELILAYETRLAKPRLSKVERRDFRNYNNRYTIDKVKEVTPSINWEKYAEDLGVKEQLDVVLVMQPKYMEEMEKVLSEGKVEDWKTLMRWATFNSAATSLSTEIEKANWDFYSKTLSGAKKQLPIEERALSVVNSSVGEAVGQIYVDKMFPPEAKAKAEEMIDDVILAFQKRIENLDWMSAETKEQAIEKLDKFTVKIGYPDEFKDYSEMQVNPENTYFENMVAVSEWSTQRNLEKVGESVDKKEWGMSPQTVNAYFNPLNNEIVFPAAILQPPFYDYKADAAVNYGGIGSVIGHEISHAFDDSGARFDGDGNLKNWWTDQDLEKFTERGKKLADLYSSIEVLEETYINGDFTLGENIGDLGGVLGGYDGLQIHFEKHGRPDKIDGFTPEQRFFISWATVWRTKIRDEALKTQVKTDPHSPGQQRAVVPLQNIDAFYEAFDITENDALYIAPEERVRIW
ncbi:M13 family metallopeptidase [Psychroflexus planctonicus]|uniref:Endothelin-converting protein n=1 Tax=Psychroflexus planctonicus TaxID=1526575 RepID=A0ABQ1SIF1_9FLAO|nr:M13 family metallopeptidase [Psychroflexus planctonicus]GGE38212.1 endothelin-converting protein [Psychroflexus planctonicus]